VLLSAKHIETKESIQIQKVQMSGPIFYYVAEEKQKQNKNKIKQQKSKSGNIQEWLGLRISKMVELWTV